MHTDMHACVHAKTHIHTHILGEEDGTEYYEIQKKNPVPSFLGDININGYYALLCKALQFHI